MRSSGVLRGSMWPKNYQILYVHVSVNHHAKEYRGRIYFSPNLLKFFHHLGPPGSSNMSHDKNLGSFYMISDYQPSKSCIETLVRSSLGKIRFWHQLTPRDLWWPQVTCQNDQWIKGFPSMYYSSLLEDDKKINFFTVHPLDIYQYHSLKF